MPQFPDTFYALSKLHLTPEFSGIGGTLKEHNADFVVEEIPAYLPCGDGEHLYLHIEKNGRPTLEVVNEIARHFRVKTRGMGYAGMKDKNAITRQYISVHTFDDGPLATLEIPGVTVLSATRHRNRLRIGHLKGNRFIIKIRDLADPVAAQPQAEKVLNHLVQFGASNAFGEQRFGYRARNHLIGRAYLLQDYELMCDCLLGQADDPIDANHEARLAYERGDYGDSIGLWSGVLSCERKVVRALARGADHESAIMTASQSQRRFFVTAFQSAIFNQILDYRLGENLFGQIIEGDVACKHLNGAMFTVGAEEIVDPTTQERAEALEISPTAPLYGYDLLDSRNTVREIEEHFLNATEVDIEAFNTPPTNLKGTRRPLRIPITEPAVEPGCDDISPYLQITFALPRGSFATTILREIMKTETPEYPWGSHRDETTCRPSSLEPENT